MNLFCGLKLGRGAEVSHSFLVDDILTFGMLSKTQWIALHHIFCRFGAASDLKINEGKSLFYMQEGIDQKLNTFLLYLVWLHSL